MSNETPDGIAADTAARAVPASLRALLHLRGADARKFLQGQLSNDMALLAADRWTLAGLHNPQGRVLALLRIAALEPEHIIALLPADLAESVATLLRRYVLRAKVTISCEPPASTESALGMIAARLPEAARVLLPPAHALDIAAGIPQVYAATSGEFVAQMLNLDCIGAISFSKGCYTGQEIIARAHYRGRMKRRMQRFVAEPGGVLAPGQAVTLSDGRSATIVDAVLRGDRCREFLAVAAIAAAAAEAGAPAGGAAAAPLPCRQLPLPYPLPE
jgi:folate-binding protein YgfZ